MDYYKRQWRELSDEHKKKISQSSTNKPKSAEHREHKSQGQPYCIYSYFFWTGRTD